MSRAQAAALEAVLEAVTLTDSGLVGSPLSLASTVRLVTPREAVSPEAAPVVYLVLSGVSVERDGIQGVTSTVYEVLAHLAVNTDTDAMLAGLEALTQLVTAIQDAPGTVADELLVGGGQVVLDRERRRVACYARVTCRTLRG